MKILLVLIALWMGAFGYYCYNAEKRANQKPYTARIISGTPYLNYESFVQIDSFVIVSKSVAILYKDGHSLRVESSWITFQKNEP